ncbi:unnamed protein product, partial [marine sediment metagenome]
KSIDDIAKIMGMDVPVGVDVSDANAAVGDVKATKTFYSVAAPRKEGTMPTKNLDPANETVEAGYYAATTLSAVDEHLAPANIKKDVNIFGKVGTYEPTLVEDTHKDASTTLTHPGSYFTVPNQSDFDLASVTDTFASGSLAYGAGFIGARQSSPTYDTALKVRIYLGGVQVGESGYLHYQVWENFQVQGFRALSGSNEIKLAMHAYPAAGAMRFYGVNGGG